MGPEGKREGARLLQGLAAGVAFCWTTVSPAVQSLDLLEGSDCQVQVPHVLIVGRDTFLQANGKTSPDTQNNINSSL